MTPLLTSPASRLIVTAGRVVLHQLIDRLPVFDPKETLLLFPSDRSTTLRNLPDHLDLTAVRTLVVVEASWEAAGSLLEHSALAGLTHIKLDLCNSGTAPVAGLYWRATPDSRGDSEAAEGAVLLSTIEAIRLALVEIAQHKAATSVVDPQAAVGLDGLLFYLKMEALRRADSIKTRLSATQHM